MSDKELFDLLSSIIKPVTDKKVKSKNKQNGKRLIR